jgi:hypothetical protein
MNIMRRISSEDAASVFAAVCERHDSFADPFSNLTPIRCIFFPTNGYSLTEAQWLALFAAHNAVSSSRIVVLPSELSQSDWDDLGCWELETAADYWALQSQGIFAIENTLIDRSGNWGIQLSQESHALVGGTSEFASALLRAYPALNNERKAFEAHWHNRSREGEDASWAISIEKCLPNSPPAAPCE